MSIRFKFRSSVSFDTIEIDGSKPYISVEQLRSKILRQKKLNNTCHKDFDLLFFDAITGQEYHDHEFKIPSGSSVIIKRVPAEPVPENMLRHHKLEASEISEDIPKGTDHNKPVEIVLEKVVPEHGEHIKFEKVANAKGIDLEKVDLPSELRCPICNAYFKEAVMIPCCQHSFCAKCICEVLPVTARCPKCYSTKYRVEHLLPNLSLRHAIEHFLESQILATPGNDMQKYVPDGESGIQGKEVSAVTRRKLDNSHGGKGAHEDLPLFADSQGENQPSMPQVCMPDEANSTSRKRGPWVNYGGGDQSFAVGNRNKKADRTCYMCGSPGHFVRNCPVATQRPMFPTGDPMFQGGYAMPYWNASAFPPVNPYMNMYGNPGMVPFNVTMAPYGVPPYVTSMYGSLPVPSGNTRTGGVAPIGMGAEQPLRHLENLEIQNSDNRIEYAREKRKRPYDYEDGGCHELERSSDYKYHKKIQSVDERYEKRSHGSYHTERSISGVEDVHSGNDRHDEARYKQYHRNSTRRHSSRDRSGSDCSRSHHHHHHQSRKESEPSYSRDEKTHGHGFRETRDRNKPIADEDPTEGHHHNKRKKVH